MREVQAGFPRGKVVRERYIVEELLGKGGFGAVYRVRDRRVKSNVFALKEVIDPNGYELDRLAFECELLKRLDHPGLPRVYRVIDDERNNRVYMLMDYIEGPNLERLRQQQPDRRFSLSRVIRILAPIVEALDYLHTQQPPIIHRDIKPSNIIVPQAGGGDGAVLVDFGIAKEYDQDSTTTAVRHCSPGYGAPEHYAHGTNTRTDIYGLAATFYTLLTGIVPVDALYRMTQMGSKHEDPLVPVNALVPEVPQYIADVLLRAMAINSDDRFATVEEFWQALEPDAIEEEAEPVSFLPAPPSDVGDVLTPAVAPILETITHSKTPEVRIHRTRREAPPLVLALIALIVVGLLAGSLFGVSSLMHSAGTSVSASKTSSTVAVKHLTKTSVVPTQQPTVKGQTPTATPGVTPTPPPSTSYPALVVSYSGNISDKFTTPSTDTTMFLSQVQQHNGAISGFFAVGPGLIGNGNFSGSVTPDNQIQFLIANGAIAPLFFQGKVQAGGTIIGTYCSQQGGQCNSAIGGYGTWNVSPSGGQSASTGGVGSITAPPLLPSPVGEDNGQGKGKGGQGKGK